MNLPQTVTRKCDVLRVRQPVSPGPHQIEVEDRNGFRCVIETEDAVQSEMALEAMTLDEKVTVISFVRDGEAVNAIVIE